MGRADGVDPLVKMAVIHHQFESIHCNAAPHHCLEDLGVLDSFRAWRETIFVNRGLYNLLKE